MSTGMILQTIIELSAITLLLIGFANEEAIADFEHKMFKNIKRIVIGNYKHWKRGKNNEKIY